MSFMGYRAYNLCRDVVIQRNSFSILQSEFVDDCVELTDFARTRLFDCVYDFAGEHDILNARDQIAFETFLPISSHNPGGSRGPALIPERKILPKKLEWAGHQDRLHVEGKFIVATISNRSIAGLQFMQQRRQAREWNQYEHNKRLTLERPRR